MVPVATHPSAADQGSIEDEVASATPTRRRPSQLLPKRITVRLQEGPAPDPLLAPRPEDTRLRTLIQGLLDGGFDPDQSPYAERVNDMDQTQYEAWERRCKCWDGQSRLYESYLASLAPPNTTRSPLGGQLAYPAQRRKVNKSLPIEKFAPKLALEQPFFIWYQTFHRELIREKADASYQLDLLYYYVDRRCFQPWSQMYSAKKMNDFNFIVSQLDKHYPDPTTPSERREQFRKLKMKSSGVLEYSNEKERLWRLAYPVVDPLKSEEFKDSWMDGLPKKIQKWIIHRDILEGTPIPNLVKGAVQYERNLLRVDRARYLSSITDHQAPRFKKSTKARPSNDHEPREKTDRATPKPKPSSRPDPSTRRCWEFTKFGSCDKGPDCPYLHIASSDRVAQPAGKDNETKRLWAPTRPAKVHHAFHTDSPTTTTMVDSDSESSN